MNWIHVNDEMPPLHPTQPNFSIQVIVTDGNKVGTFKELNVDICRYNYSSKLWQTLEKIAVTHWSYLPLGEFKSERVEDLRRSARIEMQMGRPFVPKKTHFQKPASRIAKELGWPQKGNTRYKMPFVQNSNDNSCEKKYATCMQEKTNLIGKLAMSDVEIRQLKDKIVALQLIQPEPNFHGE